MQPWAPIMETTLDGGPCERMLAVEPPQRFEVPHLADPGDGGVEVEPQDAARGRGAFDIGESGPRRLDQLVCVLVDIRREEVELVVLDAEPLRLLADSALAQEDGLAAFGELATDHGPLLERDAVRGQHPARRYHG